MTTKTTKYRVVVRDANTWNAATGEREIKRACGHEHRTMAAADACLRKLRANNPVTGECSAAWYHARVEMVARDEGVAPRTLRSAKAAATREEHARVYDGMNLPAEDIVVAWQGRVYVRRAWNGLHAFGWSRWQGAANA